MNTQEILQVFCPYCGAEAEWVENKEIYGRNYGKSYMAYLCRPCNAFVGCHQNSRRPLGTMADRELRNWRKKAHAVIDPLWKTGKLHRGQVYAQLKEHFGKDIHVGESDIATCQAVIAYGEQDLFRDTQLRKARRLEEIGISSEAVPTSTGGTE